MNALKKIGVCDYQRYFYQDTQRERIDWGEKRPDIGQWIFNFGQMVDPDTIGQLRKFR